MSGDRLTIFDTTLRDGEQAPGFSLRIDEKLKMARQLRALLARKNAGEYESRRATAKEAADAVARATRLVEWARGVVRTSPH